jgi:putative endonuclease
MTTAAADVVVEELHRAACSRCSYRGELRALKELARADRVAHFDWHRRLDAAIQLAVEYLERAGFTVLDRSWTFERAYIGIVADDHGSLVVVDVRAHVERYGRRLEEIGAGKKRVMRRLGSMWLREHGMRYDRLRVDVIGVLGDGPGGFTIEHVRGVA